MDRNEESIKAFHSWIDELAISEVIDGNFIDKLLGYTKKKFTKKYEL